LATKPCHPSNRKHDRWALAAFAKGLERLGWTIGRNIRIETRIELKRE
jgi:hypothetical protein